MGFYWSYTLLLSPPILMHSCHLTSTSCNRCYPSLFFFLLFFRFHVLYWTRTEEQKWGRLGNEATLIAACRVLHAIRTWASKAVNIVRAMLNSSKTIDSRALSCCTSVLSCLHVNAKTIESLSGLTKRIATRNMPGKYHTQITYQEM